MAQKKKNGKASTAKKQTGAKKTYTAKKKPEEPEVFETAPSSAAPWIFGIVALFLAFCLIMPSATGALGSFLKNASLGLFSLGAYLIPVFMFTVAIKYKKDYETGFGGKRILFSVLSVIGMGITWHGITGDHKLFKIKPLFNQALEYKGGGVIGGLIGSCVTALIGKIGLIIISILALIVCGLAAFGITPKKAISGLSSYFRMWKEDVNEKRSAKPIYKDKPEPFVPDGYDAPDYDNSINCEGIDPFDESDFDTEDTYAPVSDIDIEAPDYTTETVENELGKKKFPDREGVVDIDSIFDGIIEDEAPSEESDADTSEPDEDEFSIERHSLIPETKTAEQPHDEPEKPKYIFPPTTLLNIEKGTVKGESPEQLKKTAQKLVDVLASFRVKTHLVNISRGPTITRYELAPEEGVRVRSIANLVDDISLALASSGVRIEAPIPGKSAVGIEVPNVNVATVYLRDLIENETFRNNKSRVFAALGMDVAGKPVYLDISKMPHLLIAGATGMGKSVCINCMIVSLLYKASPEEVKMILIDPKKVEFGVYNSIPHLLVPVVNDAQKAAGTLQWAVKEMERRFELIESAGVRDIYNYNIETKDDPTMEFLPHIVIIIDELADLMMTAPDNVENSICRLAQKARAAGMHLIIGTQRPSVDVITGLLKANIPSRIACTVASQVDSRTILDIAGAEKLIGRGDMLFAPVGCSKPIRVQGAFVSEAEVEGITKFIKNNSATTEYSSDIIENIENEAKRCVIKKSPSESFDASDGDSSEEDPLLDKAIELAIECGKISTSLIQRRMSLGYGRAAKLIDRMEQKGIVGAPEGNKPREVLITLEQYQEMKVAGNI